MFVYSSNNNIEPQGRISSLTSQLATLTSSWRGEAGMSGDTPEDAQSRAEDAEADEDTDNDEPILSGSGGVSKVKLCLNLCKSRAALNIFHTCETCRLKQ